MFPNLWAGRPRQTPETEIRPVDSLSGLKVTDEIRALEDWLEYKRERIIQQLKEVTL